MLLAVLKRLETKLQLQDPLLFVVRTEFARMIHQLLGAVALQLLGKVSDLLLELLIRLDRHLDETMGRV